jgi:riboflavin transporter FmnP
LMFAGAPYVAFGLMWSVYILQSPGDFTAQFLSNAAGRHASRFRAIIQPWTAVWSELIRHVGVYSASGLWTGVMNQWLLLIPMIYAISLVAFFRGWKSYGPTVRAFLLSVVAMMLGMTFLNGFKALMYMVYILPLYCAVLAFGLVRLWNEGLSGRIIAMTAGVGFAALQLLASVEHIEADEYHRDYQKAIAFLRPEQAKGRSIVGTAALGFGLGFTGFEDDWRLGLYSHLDPDVVVMDRSYRYFTEQFERDEPLVFSHVVSSLTTNYHLAGRFGTFWVFERASPPSTTQVIDVKAMAMKEKGKQAEYLFEQLERSIAAPGNSSIKDTSIHAEIRP